MMWRLNDLVRDLNLSNHQAELLKDAIEGLEFIRSECQNNSSKRHS